MKKIILLILLVSAQIVVAQDITPAQKFWNELKSHCGKSYEGTITEGQSNDAFAGKRLVMHVRMCDENTIKIPFFVGEDKSRTWVLTMENDRIKLKHDHRHEDGSEDDVTQYGGTSTNTGLEKVQFFPADEETANLIPAASSNVWWITLDENTFSYNLKRLGSPNQFSAAFDLTKAVENPDAPWGWEE